MKRSSPHNSLDQTKEKEQTTLARFFSPNSVSTDPYQESTPKRSKCGVTEISTAASITLTAGNQKEEDKECIICGQVLVNVNLQTFTLHVNDCMDKQQRDQHKDDHDSGTPELRRQQHETQQQQDSKEKDGGSPIIISNDDSIACPSPSPGSGGKAEQAKSWTQLFRKLPWKIAGVWSSKEDVAPGMNDIESPETFFGEDSTSTKDARPQKRVCPLYKKLPGTPFTVDAFCYGKIPDCDAYFLSHYHSDHYRGISHTWTHGPIYCSEITARLLIQRQQVDPSYVHPLPMDEDCPIKEKSGATVRLIDANHCPGAVLFLFRIEEKQKQLRYLHTGDFRANPRMCIHPSLREPIDIVYLDTTYMNPKHIFPPQSETIAAACEIVMEYSLQDDSDEDHRETGKQETSMNLKRIKFPKDLLVVVGSYALGKERIFLALARLLHTKIFVTERKKQAINCIGDTELDELLTQDPYAAQVHVIPIQDIQPESMKAYYNSLQPHFHTMLAFRPTGWTYSPSTAEKTAASHYSSSLQYWINQTGSPSHARLKATFMTDNIKIYGVPYSEHSSFRELASFVASLDIRRIVPTVNIHSENSRKRMGDLLQKWEEEKRARKLTGVAPYTSLDSW